MSDDHDAEALLARLSRGLPDVVVVVDASGIVGWVTAEAAERLDIDTTTWVGRPVRDLVAWSEVPTGAGAPVVEVLNGRLPVARDDGAIVWVESRARMDADGALVVVLTKSDDRSDESRREQVSRLELFDTFAHEVLFAGDSHGVVTWVSASTTRVLDRDHLDFVDRHLSDWVHTDDVAKVAEQIAGMNAGSVLRVRARIRNGAGEYRWVGIDAAPALDDEGATVGFVGSLVDVGDQVSSEAAAAESSERFRLMAENSSDVVFLTDVTGQIEWCSPSVQLALGWTPGDLVGQRDRSYVHMEELATYDEALDLLALGEQVDLRLRVRTSDASYRWMRAVMSPLFDDDGVVVGRVGSWRDVTSEVMAEREEAATLARYELVVEGAFETVFLIDAQGRFDWVTPSMESVLGWDPAQLVGTASRDYVHPDDLATFLESTAGVQAGAPQSYRVRLRRSDGNYLWCQMRVRPILDERGDIVARTGSLVNVDDEVRAQADLVEERDRLRLMFDTMIDPFVALAPVRDGESPVVDFRFVAVGAAAAAALGLSAESLVGRTVSESLPEFERSELISRLAAQLDSDEPLVIVDYVPPSGEGRSARYFDIRARRSGDYMTLTWRDVTERPRDPRTP